MGVVDDELLDVHGGLVLSPVLLEGQLLASRRGVNNLEELELFVGLQCVLAKRDRTLLRDRDDVLGAEGSFHKVKLDGGEFGEDPLLLRSVTSSQTRFQPLEIMEVVREEAIDLGKELRLGHAAIPGLCPSSDPISSHSGLLQDAFVQEPGLLEAVQLISLLKAIVELEVLIQPHGCSPVRKPTAGCVVVSPGHIPMNSFSALAVQYGLLIGLQGFLQILRHGIT